MSVYKVIDIIGTSPVSWEQAATEAVERTRAGVNDIRVARVIEQDGPRTKLARSPSASGSSSPSRCGRRTPPRDSQAVILTRRGSHPRAA